MPFSHLGLSDKVLAAVAAAGYATPTPIQDQAIPHVLARRDVLGIAQTGTGKTAAFVLPMLTMLEQGRARARMPRHSQQFVIIVFGRRWHDCAYSSANFLRVRRAPFYALSHHQEQEGRSVRTRPGQVPRPYSARP